MKITRRQLRQLIKEEMLKEEGHQSTGVNLYQDAYNGAVKAAFDYGQENTVKAWGLSLGIHDERFATELSQFFGNIFNNPTNFEMFLRQWARPEFLMTSAKKGREHFMKQADRLMVLALGSEGMAKWGSYWFDDTDNGKRRKAELRKLIEVFLSSFADQVGILK